MSHETGPQGPSRYEGEPDTQWVYRIKGGDWPTGQIGMSLGDIFAALDAITPDTCVDAQVSLDALDQRLTSIPQQSAE